MRLNSARRFLSSLTQQREAAKELLDQGIMARQADKLDEAVQLLGQSRAQWHVANDRQGEAKAIKELASVMKLKGNRSSYLSHLITYKELAEPYTLGQPGGASLELELGIGYYHLGNLSAALQSLENARIHAAAEKNELLEARALLFLARVKKDPQMALKAIEKFVTYGDKHLLEQQRAMCVLAGIHEEQKDYEAALEALRAARNVSEGKDKSRVYRWAANIFLKQADAKSDREAMTCLKTALSIADGVGDKLGVVSSSFQLGNVINSMLTDSQEPLPYWKQALVTIQEIKESNQDEGGSLLPMESAILTRLADHHVRTRQFGHAISYATQLVDLLRTVTPVQSYTMLSALKTLAGLQAQSGNMNDASKTWTDALSLGVKDSSVLIGKASSLWHLGQRQEARSVASMINVERVPKELAGDLALLQARTGDGEVAKKLAATVIRSHSEEKQPTMTANILAAESALALVALAEKKTDEARRLAGKTLAAAIKMQSYPMMLEALQTIAESELESDFQKARATAEKLMRLANSCSDKLTKARAAVIIGRSHEAEGDNEEAVEFYKLAVSMFHHSDNRRGAFLTLSRIQTIYEKQGMLSKADKTRGEAVEEATKKD